MTEADLYKELGALTKDKDRWKESIPQNKKTQLYKSKFLEANYIPVLST